tara:strand:- start:1563 stop:2144 length:582 start_codon:yes stop_codon:yes gene_type:complete
MKPGRKRVLTDDQRKEKQSANHKKWRDANRDKSRAIQRRYDKRVADRKKEIKNNPFNDMDEVFRKSDTSVKHERSLRRMAELLKVGCTEKKSKGSNCLSITGKLAHTTIFEMIYGKSPKYDYQDRWISRSWSRIALKINGWNDISKRQIYLDKMITYGILVYVQELPKDIVNIILSYLKWKPMTYREIIMFGN